MIREFPYFIGALSVVLFSFASNANGVSPYLPLKLDNLVELEIERLVSIAQLPSLKKPYHIVTVVNYLQKVKHSHPKLYNRLNDYIKRYKKQSSLTHFSAEVGHSFSKNKTIPNGRGFEFDDVFQGSVSSFYQFNKYVIFNAGGSFSSNNGVVPHNSYLSFGTDYFQFDVGYREHWLSPMQESAALLSTNAEPIASITLSNVKPITDFNINYEMSFGLLSKMDGIHFDNRLSSGKPGLLTMHLSVQPFDWWTIGANRVFQFGGGDRSIGLGDIWNAFIDPVSSDNCGGESTLQDCNEEVGNQIASITTKFDFSIYNFPISIFYEYGGEDAKNYKKSLGNIGITYGVFLPYLSNNTSLYVEHSIFHDKWYVHHLYDEGYRNKNVIMGHWWANEKSLNDDSGVSLSTVRFNWDINSTNHLEILIKTGKLDTLNQWQNNRTKEMELNLKHAYKSGFIGLSLNVGKDTFGDSFSRASVSYNW
ncbi:capsule assembly Wzi family protein [Colwelliaceae bacterium 6471]